MADVFPPHVDDRAELERLRAENADLRRKLAEREWKPIETAPKDSRFIWLAGEFKIRIGYWSINSVDPDSEFWADFADSEAAHRPRSLGFEPLHWQPVPRHPSYDAGRRSDAPRTTEAAS